MSALGRMMPAVVFARSDEKLFERSGAASARLKQPHNPK
jgi:hypothetical protein